MSGRTATWITATAGVAVVTGAVAFLSLQTLADADSWSSVGAFLAALITVVVSVVGWVSTRDASNPDATGHTRRRWLAFNLFNRTVFVGDGNHNQVYGDGRPTPAAPGRDGRPASPDPRRDSRPTSPDPHRDSRPTSPDPHRDSRPTSPDPHRDSRPTSPDPHRDSRPTSPDPHRDSRPTSPGPGVAAAGAAGAADGGGRPPGPVVAKRPRSRRRSHKK